jgi:hypothetical protein
MRSILSMIKVTIGGVLLFLSLSCAASSDTTSAKSDQSVDRIGGQAGEAIRSEQRPIGSRQLGGDRVGGQAGEEPALEERPIGSRQLGGDRVGGQAGESDPEKPASEAK